jgi:hypothetical protein
MMLGNSQNAVDLRFIDFCHLLMIKSSMRRKSKNNERVAMGDCVDVAVGGSKDWRRENAPDAPGQQPLKRVPRRQRREMARAVMPIRAR